MTEKPHAPACERNRDPILEVLRKHLGGCRRVLEIGSGTGQHAAYFAARMPWLTWQCTDRAGHLPGIRMWLDEAGLPNTPAPIELDVESTPWLLPPLPSEPLPPLPFTGEGWGEGASTRTIPVVITREHTCFDAVFSANTLHIMGWREVEAFFTGVGDLFAKIDAGSGVPSSGLRPSSPAKMGKVLQENGGILVVYGPFNYGGDYSSASNRDFDAWLKARDPKSGIRDFEAVDALARDVGLRLAEDVAMPANNRCVVWRSAAA